MMFTQSVVLLRAPQVAGRLGARTRDWANATETPVDQVAVQPRTSSESTADPRDQTITGWRLYTRAGVDLDIEPTDRVRWGGRDLEVIGEVARWPHPIIPGAVHHIEVDLQRVSG